MKLEDLKNYWRSINCSVISSFIEDMKKEKIDNPYRYLGLRKE